MAQGVLEWKRSKNIGELDNEVQGWLDRFYMSRIGIRFLIGQRECWFLNQLRPLTLGLRRRSEHSTTTRRLRRDHLYQIG